MFQIGSSESKVEHPAQKLHKKSWLKKQKKSNYTSLAQGLEDVIFKFDSVHDVTFFNNTQRNEANPYGYHSRAVV